jgi:hypothetical protein
MTTQTIFSEITTYAPVVIAAAAGAAAALPKGAPGSKWAKARAVIDFLALNFGNAKNAEPK